MTGATIDRQGRWWRAVAGMLAILVVVTSYTLSPDRLPLGPCFFKQTTGVSCLSCGLTRSFHACAHGQWPEAFRFHVFGPLFFMGVLILGFLAGGEAISGTKLVPRPPALLVRRLILGGGMAWLAFGILRAAVEIFS
jgi:hypothetical protein